jgi:hypothetical protein
VAGFYAATEFLADLPIPGLGVHEALQVIGCRWHSLPLIYYATPMTTPVPYDVFSAELLPGETIEWTGRPNPSVVFHREDWFVVPFSILWGGFAMFWLLTASGMWGMWNRPEQQLHYFGVVWGTPFVLIGQYMIWGRFLYQRWENARTYYALTERRALIVRNGFRSRTCMSAYFGDLAMIDKFARSDGIGSISFGAPLTGRWMRTRGSAPRCPTFDDVDDADSVYRVAMRLKDRFRIAKQF